MNLEFSFCKTSCHTRIKSPVCPTVSPLLCYIVIYWFMQKYTYICWIHTDAMINRRTQDKDAMIKTQEDFFIKIYLLLTLFVRVRKGCSRFACEREMETEHNWNILTPKLWPLALCLSRSPWLLNRSLGVHSTGCWLSLLHLVLLRLQLYSTQLSNSSAIYYLQTPTRW